ncbi:MAG: sn-glycerol-1-phosphate dehydrogenase, partial [Pseudomonadota bacterium]
MSEAQLIADAVARSGAIADVVVGNGVLAKAGEMMGRHFQGGPAHVICDENTRAAGEALFGALTAAGVAVSTTVLPAAPRPKPTVELANALAADIGERVPVALGSGVINDVVKYAAFSLGRPYFCVATAASMDGYTSAGSPLSEGGFKKTIPTRAPLVILADLDVVAKAPAAMSGWGYGDLAGKVPAGGDWIVADALGVEAIDDVAWPLVQNNLAGWLSDPDGVKAGDPDAISALFAGLTLSGLAMEFHGSSRPASGADHQIAHLWEMESLTHEGERVSHGACVSVATMAVMRLYDWLIGQDLAGIDAGAILVSARTLDEKTAEMGARLPKELAKKAAAETAAKHASP